MMSNAAMILKQLSVTNLTGNLITQTENLPKGDGSLKQKLKDLGRNYSLDSPAVQTTSSLD